MYSWIIQGALHQCHQKVMMHNKHCHCQMILHLHVGCLDEWEIFGKCIRNYTITKSDMYQFC